MNEAMILAIRIFEIEVKGMRNLDQTAIGRFNYKK